MGLQYDKAVLLVYTKNSIAGTLNEKEREHMREKNAYRFVRDAFLFLIIHVIVLFNSVGISFSQEFQATSSGLSKPKRI